MCPARLPLELILHIVDAIVDFGDAPAIAIAANDWRTTQLRQWMLVSKATSEVAVRHLYSHCLHIDSNRKLMLLVRTINPPRQDKSVDIDQQSAMSFKYLSCIQGLYLAPFTGQLDDQPSAVWIFELMCLVGPYLKRLAFDFPFSSLALDRDHLAVYQYLRNGFERLVNIEELVYICDDSNLVDRWTLALEHSGLWWCMFRKLTRLVGPWKNLPDTFAPVLKADSVSLPPLEQVALHLHGYPWGGNRLLLDKLVGDGPAVLKIIQVHAPFASSTQPLFISGLAIKAHDRVELHSMTLTHDFKRLLSPSDFMLAEAVHGRLWTRPTVRHSDLRMELYRSDMIRLDLGGYSGLLWNLH